MRKILSLAVCAALFTFSMHAYGINANLVVNGDFETGSFTGWTVDTQSENGSWFVYSGGILPLSFHLTPPPPGGAYAATADQISSSSTILYQDIDLPTVTHSENLILQYTYYYNNQNNIFISPDSLSIEEENQQARIDIMKPTAEDPYSVAPSDIYKNLLSTPPGSPLVVNPTTVEFDLTRFSGRSIRLRFAVVDTEYFFSMGVDNISILVKKAPPPQRLPEFSDSCESSDEED